jgi:hypothetical protein
VQETLGQVELGVGQLVQFLADLGARWAWPALCPASPAGRRSAGLFT